MAQQHQGPSKGHFNPSGHQASRVQRLYRDALCHQQSHHPLGKGCRWVWTPSTLLWDTVGHMESPDTAVL